jgi:hypothetical protein
MQQPQWIKDLKAGKSNATQPNKVAEQFTVLRRTPTQTVNPQIRPMSSGEMSSGTLPRSQMQVELQKANNIPQPMSRLTGAGVDGQVQPNKMTGQVHEGEGVINANAMQNLSPDEFNAFSKALETGALDKNTFRQAIGLQPVAGYSLGGIVQSFGDKLKSVGDKIAEPFKRPEERRATVEPITVTPTVRTQAQTTPQTIETPTPIASSIVANPNPKLSSAVAAPKVENVTFQNAPSQAPAQVTPVATPTPRTASTPATPTPLSVVNAPAPNDRSTYYNDLFTNATGKDYRGTAAMAQENYDNSTMQRSGAAQAAAAAATAQELNQAGVSAAGKASQNAELARTQSASSDNLRSNLANQFTNNLSTFSNIDISQRQQGMNEKQKAIDNTRYDQEAAIAAEQTAYDRTQDAIKNARLDKADATAIKTTAQTDMENRLGMLFNSGSTLQAAQSDSTLQNLVKSYLGESATPEQVANEISMMYNSATNNNRDTFISDVEKYLGDAIDNKKPLEEVLNDQNIRRKVAGYLGPNATPEDINKEISTRFNELNMPDYMRIFNNFSENWVSDDIKKVPGWDTDLQQTIQYLNTKGIMNADGSIKEGAVFDWPWEDPDTMFKYQDWNGNAASGGTYDQAQEIKLDGNGTKYANSSGSAVTMADANGKWNSLSSVDRSSFIKDGKMDTAAFLAKYFPTTKDSSGNTVALTTRADFTNKVISDPTYLDTIGDVLEEFQSSGKYPGDPLNKTADTPNAGDPVPKDYYIYYDANGDAQVANKSENNKLAYIYQQLNDKYNKTSIPFTAGQFQEYWKDGKDWRIGGDGTILNIDNPGQNIPSTELPGVKALADWDPVSTNALDASTISSLSKLSAKERSENDLYAEMPSGWGEFFLDSINTPVFTNNKKKAYTADGTKWVDSNIGKLYLSSNGVTYQIVGSNYDSGEAHVLLRDLSNNDIVKHNLKTNDNYNVVGNLSNGKYGNVMDAVSKTMEEDKNPETLKALQYTEPMGEYGPMTEGVTAHLKTSITQ